jgi:hypothetical protein
MSPLWMKIIFETKVFYNIKPQIQSVHAEHKRAPPGGSLAVF